uniref:Polycystin cation channel PKD1/PKD2 domain-containing protein n=1 Tax=Dunaliella tertiolecta TaxID=3047 RepID=A0A7S3VQ04_DUNTE
MDAAATIRAVVTSILVQDGGEGTTWTDPGCTASDAVDGDISDRVVSQLVQVSGQLMSQTGRGARMQVPDAHRPTAPDAPWLVRYMVQDAAGNAARARLREVHITCPEGEKVCEEDVDGSTKRSCSVEGVCLDDALPEFGSGNNKERTRPSLSLLGSMQVKVPVNGKYERCAIDSTVSPCDRGVKAEDTVEGNIQSAVTFSCSFKPVGRTEEVSSPPNSLLYTISQLSACGFSTSAPGTWTITYQVSNDVGMSSEPRAVSRTVSVTQVCLPGEISCENGSCADDLNSCTLNGGGDASIDGSTKPQISLQRVQGTLSPSDIVSVKKGTPYEACTSSPSSLPSTEVCEPGATALDAAEGDISRLVLSCPGSCIEGTQPSCSPGHLYISKGIQGCEIDTLNAEVGTLYELSFAVISPSSGLVAQTFRLIQVVSPCPAGQNSCSGTCVEVSCDIYNQINSGRDSAGRPSVTFSAYSKKEQEQQEQRQQRAPRLDIAVGREPDVQQIPALLRQEEEESRRRLLQTGFTNTSLHGLQQHLQQQTYQGPTQQQQQQHKLQQPVMESGIHKHHLATVRDFPLSSWLGRRQETMPLMQDAFPPSQQELLATTHPGRSLLQGGGSSSSSSNDPFIVNLAFGETQDMVSPDLAWANPRLAPCRSSEENCGVRASDSLGNDLSQAIRVDDITPCSSASNSMDWWDWVQSIQSAPTRTEDSGCPSMCSPSAADRAQCPPARHAFRYEVEDTVGRTTAHNVFVRIEAGAAHALNVTMALSCSAGAAELQEQVSEMGVDVALPYLQALGLEMTNLRQIALLDEPKVVLQGDGDGPVVHPGIAALSMPPLCLVQVALGLQVGCTPEVKGYQSGPGERETMESWCPCSVEWNPSYKDNPLTLDSGSRYTIVNDLYGPLIGFSLGYPLNSTASSPVPHCAPLTIPLNITEVRVKQAAAYLSGMEDASTTMLAALEALASSIQSIHDTHEGTDGQIEEQFRSIMGDYLDSYVVSLDGQLQDMLTLLSASQVDLNTGVQSVASSISNLQNATLEIGMAVVPPPPPSETEVERAIEQCVTEKRLGADTEFFFTVPFQDQEGSTSPSSRKLQSLADTDQQGNQEYFGRVRVAGLRGNQMLSGAFLHQERRPLASLLPGGSYYHQICHSSGLARILAAECTTSSSSVAAALVVEREKGTRVEGLDLYIGVDPIFVKNSPMFDPQIAAEPEMWYNTSSSAQMAAQGIPHGFALEPLPGLPLGYPLVFDINLGSLDGKRMIEFLKHGNYLSRISTTNILAVFPTYNRDTQLYGHATMRAQWTDNGRIEANFVLEALEFRDYTNAGLQAEGMRSRLATDMVLLVFILVYCMLTAKDVVESFAAQQRRNRMLQELHHHMREEMRARVDATELQTFHTRLDPTYKPKKQRRASSVAVPPSKAPSQMLLGSGQSQLLLDSQPSQLLVGTRASAELPSGDASGREEGKGKEAFSQGDGGHRGAGIESKLSGHLKQVASAKSAPSRWLVACELEPSDSEQPQQQKGRRGVSELEPQHHHSHSSKGSASPAPGLVAVGRSEHVSPLYQPGHHHSSSSSSSSTSCSNQ